MSSEQSQHDRRRFLGRAGAVAGAAWVAPQVLSQTSAAAQSGGCVDCDENLVVNPSAESFSGNPDYDNALSPCADETGAVPIPADWTTENGLRVVSYGHCDFPTSTDVTPTPTSGPAQGSVMFSGTLTSAATPARAYQDVDVSVCSASIDAGLVDYTLRAYLGGNPSIASVASAYALFYDVAPPLPLSGTALPPPGTLGSASLGPLDSTTLSTTELVQSTATGTVPIGTLVVRLALEITTPTGAVPLDGRITGCIDMVDFTIC